MRKILLSCVLCVLVLGSAVAEDPVLVDVEFFTYITPMTAENYTMRIKETGPIAATESSADGFTIDRDPFVYRDITPPDPPPGLIGVALNSSTIKLTFLSAYDNTRVIGYNIFRDGLEIDFTADESYVDTPLQPSTFYSYAVQAVDKRLNVSEMSETVYVTTLDSVSEASPPQFIIRPSVRYVTDKMAIIGFTTDKATVATLDYVIDTGSDIVYDSSVAATEYGIEHSIPITRLESGFQYHYRVTITDFDNTGSSESSNYSFWTLNAADTKSPEFITYPQVAYISDNRAVVTFQTDEDTVSYIRYGIDSIDEYWVEEAYYSSDHSITLFGLEPLSTYTYQVVMTDRSGNGPVGSEITSFTTVGDPDTTAPLILGKPKVAYLSDSLAVIRWATDELSNSVVDFGTAKGNYERKAVSQVYARDHLVVLSNLSERTRYYFKVSSADAADTSPSGGNIGTEIVWGYGNHDDDSDDDDDGYRDGQRGNHYGVFTFNTKRKEDVRSPTIRHIQIATTESAAAIAWTTNEIAESKVIYWPKSGELAFQKGSWKLANTHLINLTGLEPHTRYEFQIVSTDPGSNEAITRVYSFRTVNENRGRGRHGQDDDGSDDDDRPGRGRGRGRDDNDSDDDDGSNDDDD